MKRNADNHRRDLEFVVDENVLLNSKHIKLKAVGTKKLLPKFLGPITVLGSAGTLFKCLDRATKELDIPNARKKKLYSKLHLHSIHSLQNLVSQLTIPGKTKANCRSKGKNKRQIASLPTQPVHRGRPVNRPTPSRLPAFIFILFYHGS
jgi:hypothetical protein